MVRPAHDGQKPGDVSRNALDPAATRSCQGSAGAGARKPVTKRLVTGGPIHKYASPRRDVFLVCPLWSAMYLRAALKLALLGQIVALAGATVTDPKVLDACPGYAAKNVVNLGHKLTADLVLNGKACNVFGDDIAKLKLEVTYENSEFSAFPSSLPSLSRVEHSSSRADDRIHLKITDPADERYEIPEDVLPRPKANLLAGPLTSNIRFNYTTSPFAFSVYRASTHEVLFSTASHPIIFEPQYLRVKTDLPTNANIYGLGEHTDTFRLPTHNYTRTMWSRDAFGVPHENNLYGNHPIYFEHRTTGSHGVFLVNSNGMDIKLDDANGVQTLEYNIIGGVLDFYFLAGSESDPVELVRQYADVVGTPAEVPYWSFGFHQCRFGYLGEAHPTLRPFCAHMLSQTTSMSPRSSRTTPLRASLSRRCGPISVCPSISGVTW